MSRLPALRYTFCLVLLLGILPSGLRGQSTEDSIKASVNALFNAMRKSDSLAITHCFAQGGQLQSVDENGKVQSIPIGDFAHIIAAIPVGAADERPRIDVLRVDGNLAMVWAPYSFIYKGTPHHCGVDSFQLVRQNGGQWKIQYIIDTEHRQGCPAVQ